MKRLLSCLTFACFAWGLTGKGQSAEAALPTEDHSRTPEAVLRLHAVGFRQLSATPDGTVFKEIWNLPATTQLRNETLDKLAGAIAGYLQSKNNDSSPKPSNLLRPLLDDLWAAEVFADLREPAPGQKEFVLAIHLNEARAKVWESNWGQLNSGWRLGKSPSRLATFQTNSWFAVHWVAGEEASLDRLAAAHPILRRLREGQAPSVANREHWVEIDGDLARLCTLLNLSWGKDLPQVDFTLHGRKEYLRSQAHITLRAPMESRVEKWQVPLDTLRDPIISFTALQGIGPWLKSQPMFKELGLGSVPNQVYTWGLTQTPFQIQAAVPVADGTRAFNAINQKLVPGWNNILAEYAIGKFHSLTDRADLVWRGLPILVPYIQPITDHGRSFLQGGIFPVDPPPNLAPTELFQKLTTQTNLLYYDWEVTQARLGQLRPLLQLAAVFLTVSPMSTNSSAFRWLDTIEPRLGNTITEVSVKSPRELDLLRTSHLGLNGLEVLSLANWLEGTNFPRSNLDIRFRPALRTTRQKDTRSR